MRKPRLEVDGILQALSRWEKEWDTISSKLPTGGFPYDPIDQFHHGLGSNALDMGMEIREYSAN
jgi:hypothetical protein